MTAKQTSAPGKRLMDNGSRHKSVRLFGMATLLLIARAASREKVLDS
jgi:hypothetical protein